MNTYQVALHTSDPGCLGANQSTHEAQYPGYERIALSDNELVITRRFDFPDANWCNGETITHLTIGGSAGILVVSELDEPMSLAGYCSVVVLLEPTLRYADAYGWTFNRNLAEELLDVRREKERLVRELDELVEKSTESRRLVGNSLRNAGRCSDESKPRWAHVRAALGVGSHTAYRLCREHGIEPDEEIGGNDGRV